MGQLKVFKCFDTYQTYFVLLQIKPVVGKVYSFNDVPDAYQEVSYNRGRGKVVIDMTS